MDARMLLSAEGVLRLITDQGMRGSRWMRRCSALLAAGSLAACVPIPPQPDPHVALPVAWSADENATQAPVPDLTGWWRCLGDARLDQLIDAALSQNLGIAQAQYRLRAARAQSRATELRYFPGLSARTVSAPNVESTASYFQIGFDATWELGLFGRRRGDEAVGQADIALAESDLVSARVSVVAEVARSYIELRAAQARVATERSQLTLAEQTFARTERLRALGLADSTDVDKAQVAIDEAQARVRADATVPLAQALALAALLGRTEADPSWLEEAPLPTLPAAAVLPTPAQLLRTRPEIQHAEAEVARAAGELGIARSELWPQLNIGGTLTYASKLDGDELLRPTSIVSFGPMISMPLFDWGMRRATVVARGELLAAATTHYREAVIDAAKEVQTGLGALAAARARYAMLNDRVRGAPRRHARVERLQTLGLSDDAARADVARSELGLEAERSDAQSAALQALVAVYKALGGAPPPVGAEPSA